MLPTFLVFSACTNRFWLHKMMCFECQMKYISVSILTVEVYH